jgi:hypothetical protein
MKSADQTLSGSFGTYSGSRSRGGNRRFAARLMFSRMSLYTR